MIKIMNLRTHQPSKPFDFYIDRRSPVGNPFPMQRESLRDRVCDEYEKYFSSQVEIHNTLFMEYLEGIRHAHEQHDEVRLFCWCSPKRCHGETIKNWLMGVPKRLQEGGA